MITRAQAEAYRSNPNVQARARIAGGEHTARQ